MTRSPRSFALFSPLALFAVVAPLALVGLVAAAPAGAQQAADVGGGDSPVFGESIDVRVVNVEVVATDRDGNRVSGLQPHDFRLVVDGEEVPIDYFTEVRGGEAILPSAGAGAGSPLPGLPAVGPGEPVGTSFLVFIDDYFPLKRDRDRVLAALADDLPALGPADRMAIVAFDGRQVEMLSSWTGSRPQLERALDRARVRPAYGLQWLGFQRSYENAFGSRSRPRAGVPTSAFDLTVDERGFAREIELRVAREVGAAVATLRGFAQPPGRKVMLLLSGGWPFAAGQFAANDLGRPLMGFGYDDGVNLYRPLTDTANLLGFTLYPVDVPGLGDEFGANVERRTDFARNPDFEPRLGNFERERLVQDSLTYLARETGGQAMINAQRLAALPRVVADTRSYYWIGFTPDRSRDDGLHDIRVEPTDRRLKARTRESFRDLSRGAESDMAVESALLFGAAPAGGRLLVVAGEPTPAGRRYIEVPVRLAIPMDAFTTLAEGGDRVVRLELRVAAKDGSNRTSDVAAVPIELRFPAEPAAGAAVSYDTRLKLRNAHQDLVVSLLDPLSGESLMARLEVTP